MLFSTKAVASLSLQQEAERIMREMYNHTSLALTTQEKRIVEELLVALLNSSICEQVKAACLVVHELQENLTKKVEEEDRSNRRKEQLRLFVLHHYLEHLGNFIVHNEGHCTYLEKIQLQLAKAGVHFTQNKKVKQLARLLSTYLTIEYNQILLVPSRAHTFLRRYQNRMLPSLIEFWHQHTIQEKLLRRVNRIMPEVIAQFFEEILMVGMQSILFGGSSMYNNWISQQAEKVFEQYVTEQNKIQSDFSAYLKKLSDDQAAIAQAIVQGFVKAQADLQKQFSDVNQQQKQEISYLLRSLNLVLPLGRYLSSPPVSYDQLFEAGIMYTPGNTQWYNIFQLQQTDWEYDSQSNSFVQYGPAPFTTPYWSDKNSGFDPAQSSIFADYIAPKRSYELEVEVTLINATYPFFIGIIFNRGRWISADPEKLSQYRLLGIYGQQSAQQQPVLTLHFAEQKITIENNVETITSPLEQITTDQKTTLATLPSTIGTELARDPQHFIISIKSTPQAITYAVTHKKSANQSEQIASGTLSNLSKELAIYSGLGFLAVGNQASFKINKPTTLQYTPAQIAPFMQTLQKIITSFAQNTGGK